MLNIPLVQLSQVTKVYKGDFLEHKAVDCLSIDLFQKEFVVLMGYSGSGKSTLLNIIASIDLPTNGEVRYQGEDLSSKNNRELALHRLNNIAFILQDYGLIPILNVKENIAYPLTLSRRKNIKDDVILASKELGIDDLLDKFPRQLSGGQQQRVAIARALVSKSKLVIADEPTASLDEDNTHRILNLLSGLKNKTNATIVLATHDPIVKDYADRIVYIKDGKIEKIVDNHEK